MPPGLSPEKSSFISRTMTVSHVSPMLIDEERRYINFLSKSGPPCDENCMWMIRRLILKPGLPPALMYLLTRVVSVTLKISSSLIGMVISFELGAKYIIQPRSIVREQSHTPPDGEATTLGPPALNKYPSSPVARALSVLSGRGICSTVSWPGSLPAGMYRTFGVASCAWNEFPN